MTEQTEQTSVCEYCMADSDDYIKPLEKNAHAFIRCAPIYGWVIELRANGWSGEAQINYCPMCGRKLRNG